MLEVDVAFLGGGPAGYQGAIRAAQLGAKVAVVEKSHVGGVCLNWGCIPTKTVRASAEVGRAIRRAKEFGFEPVQATPDMKAIIARKDRVVRGLRGAIKGLFQANRISLVEGQGRLVRPDTIDVEGTESVCVRAENIVIAAGSSPASIPGITSARIFTPDEMLTSDILPKTLLVIGGGAVGVEMAAIFQELGSQVTIVEAMGQLLPSEDAEMAEYLRNILKRRKVRVCCGTRVSSLEDTSTGVSITLSDGTQLSVEAVLVAVGRRPNIDCLELPESDWILDERRIAVDAHMQTSVPGIYAAGDITGGWLLAHMAFAEGICAAEHALGHDSIMSYDVIPRCVFSIPEYAAVGLSEQAASVQHRIKVARFPLKSLGMAQAIGELEGLVKLITDADSDLILGAHVIGPHGADLVQEVAVAMRAGMPSKILMQTIHSHPSLSEALMETAQSIHDCAIHQAPAQIV